MILNKSSKQLVIEANSEIRTLTIDEAFDAYHTASAIFIDIREQYELEQRGYIPNVMHIPRGVLEFKVDPESPYYERAFDACTNIILFCQSGWRSALATLALQNMGVMSVAHIDGGYNAWLEADGPIEKVGNL